MRATPPLLLALALLPIVALTVPADDVKYPTDYFRSPLGIPLVLSGNFAEMREGHFHGGLDIRTRESEGYRIYAAADGYIERVKVSPFGYGNALYVAHPNGYTTVYGHLSRFKGEIARFVRSTQYRRRSFEVDEYLEAGRFPVKKGQVIALSGNSGSSSGPHLHFEIRTTRDQVPVNPLLFGMDVPDSQTPRIFRIKIYPRDAQSGVILDSDHGGRLPSDPVTLDVQRLDGVYRVKTAGRIQAWGRIAFGIQTHDYHNGSRSRLGAYRIILETDGEERFASVMERISFADTRYINAHVDYAERRKSRRWIQRSFRLPGNMLPIYRSVDDGVVTVEPGHTLVVRYVVDDAAGNRSTLSFEVSGVQPRKMKSPVVEAPGGIPVSYDEPLSFERDDLRIEMPANALYEDGRFSYSKTSAPRGAFSSFYEFVGPLTPVHRRYRISIRPDSLPPGLREKALIATLDEEGKTSAVGGRFSNGFVTGRTRRSGGFFVAVDTTAPEITSLDLRPGDRIGPRRRFSFRARDDLAGISSYVGHLDGKWVLVAYDAKRDMLIYDADPTMASGDHTINIRVTDAKQNVGEVSVRFVK